MNIIDNAVALNAHNVGNIGNACNRVGVCVNNSNVMPLGLKLLRKRRTDFSASDYNNIHNQLNLRIKHSLLIRIVILTHCREKFYIYFLNFN